MAAQVPLVPGRRLQAPAILRLLVARQVCGLTPGFGNSSNRAANRACGFPSRLSRIPKAVPLMHMLVYRVCSPLPIAVIIIACQHCDAQRCGKRAAAAGARRAHGLRGHERPGVGGGARGRGPLGASALALVDLWGSRIRVYQRWEEEPKGEDLSVRVSLIWMTSNPKEVHGINKHTYASSRRMLVCMARSMRTAPTHMLLMLAARGICFLPSMHELVECACLNSSHDGNS